LRFGFQQAKERTSDVLQTRVLKTNNDELLNGLRESYNFFRVGKVGKDFDCQIRIMFILKAYL
jgi:hypothetical protein